MLTIGELTVDEVDDEALDARIKKNLVMDADELGREHLVYVCSDCGSRDVEAPEWVHMNTGKVGDGYTQDRSCWCNDCELDAIWCTLKDFIERERPDDATI